MRLLVNDYLTTIPGSRTFWHDLQEWFSCRFVGGDYAGLAAEADRVAGGERCCGCGVPLGDCLANHGRSGAGCCLACIGPRSHQRPSLIIRNASWFGPIAASATVPTIGLLQDILEPGPAREMQQRSVDSCRAVVFNTRYTAWKFGVASEAPLVIPLPVDFRLFEPGNPMGFQQKLMLPDGCILWVGASQGAAGAVKGWPTFLQIVRANPDLHFVAVFKDAAPAYGPPNLRMYSRVSHKDLVQIIGACRVGLCTSAQESQHLAGIEMGACGLPLVVPPVGTYWKRDNSTPGAMPGVVLGDPTVGTYAAALRGLLEQPFDAQSVRAYWRREFDPEVVRAAWTRLVEEVECSGRS